MPCNAVHTKESQDAQTPWCPGSIQHCAPNNDSHHEVPARRLQSGNLVSWAGDCPGDRVHHKPKVSGQLFGDEVTLLPVQAPA